MGNKPTHKISIVRDGKGNTDEERQRDARWQLLGHLWPTRNGNGFTGSIKLSVPLLIPSDGIRIVISLIERDDEEAPPTEDSGELPT